MHRFSPDGAGALGFHGAIADHFWISTVSWCKKKKALSPQQAIYKLTGLPARVLGLRDRGVLRQGARADIAISTHCWPSAAPPFEPNQLAAGIVAVLVNGVITLRDGVLTGARTARCCARDRASGSRPGLEAPATLAPP
ncbi:MAG: amidohydrolase family protein [Gammaproteobacteria bacterium]